MSSKPIRKIAIIGAGPGGLTLAALLAKGSIPVTIYERDIDMGARSQGGTLDLHSESGQLALAEAGLIEVFKKNARYSGEDFKMTTSDMTMLIDQEAGGRRGRRSAGDRPRFAKEHAARSGRGQ